MIKTIEKHLPKWKFVPSFNFIKEAINSGNCLTLVVTAENDDLFWESSFKSKEKANDFTALLASVDVVTQEEISQVSAQYLILLILLVFIGHFLEHMKKIAVLAVNITKNFDWCLKLLEESGQSRVWGVVSQVHIQWKTKKSVRIWSCVPGSGMFFYETDVEGPLVLLKQKTYRAHRVY